MESPLPQLAPVVHRLDPTVGGVVFGYFAALTYWFPKIFGFRLNERLGTYAFCCWFFGFLLAFIPLYILGIMGATRRLDHYDASLGWQGLFIVSAVGVSLILLGVGFQLLQLFVSIKQRKQNLDTTGDAWNGRTLEWSTSSPAPVYNFAHLTPVKDRDAWWSMKQQNSHKIETFEDIEMPKNTPFGLFIAGFALLFGFAAVWHSVLLAVVGFAGAIGCLIIRTLDDDTEYTISAAEVKAIETAIRAKA